MEFLTMLCVGTIALLFAAAVCFGGYRLFFFLLPIWGFFFGFALGAQTMQALLNESFLATTTSWVIGLVVGVVFAVLSYLYFAIAVAVLSASWGYALGLSIMGAIFPSFGVLNWLVAVALGIAVAFAVFRFHLIKPAIIGITAMLGAGLMIFILLGAPGAAVDATASMTSPVQTAISSSFWWLIFFVGMSVAGFYVQWQSNKHFTLEEYNRMDTYTTGTAA